MALSHMTAYFKEGGAIFSAKTSELTNKVPVLKSSFEFVKDHPWISLGAALGTYVIYKVITHPRDLPPGPWNMPLIGAVPMIRLDMAEYLHEQKSVYGDLVYFKMFGFDMVILNSEQTMKDCLIKLGEDFVHRQDLASQYLMYEGSPDEIFLAPYNEAWKEHKKFAMMGLRSFGFGTPKSEEKINAGLDKLEEYLCGTNGRPVNPHHNLKCCLFSIVMAVVFNEDYELNDPAVQEKVKIITDWIDFTLEFLMEAFLFENYPLLIQLLFRKQIKKGIKMTRDFKSISLEILHKRREEELPDEPRDIVDYYLKERGNDPALTDEILAANFASFFADATHTGSVAMMWVLYYLAKHPEIQRKIQDQIDEKLGQQTKPSLSQKQKLSHVEALFFETMRLRNLFSMSGPRQLHKDVFYKSYRLPRGSLVIANFYAIHNDPNTFPDPEKFDPMRFIDSEGKIDPAKTNSVVTFSVGKRSCPGEHYMRAKLLMAVTRVLQKFTVSFGSENPNLNDKYRSEALKPPPEQDFCFTVR